MSMKYETTFESPADGLPISLLALIPVQKPCRGILQLVHGMCENKERYLPFMQYMTDKGYVTVIHDHRGHGKSVRGKADLGYTYGGKAEAILADLQEAGRLAKERFPGLPLILLGHSMGSLAVRAYTRRHDDSLDMLIICGTPADNAARPLGTVIAKTEQAIFGPRHRSRLIEALSFGSCVLRFKNDPECKDWICSDKAVCDAYHASESCGFTFTDDAYLALFDLMKQAYDIEHWQCTNKKLPVLFLSGADDPCMIDVRHFAKAVHAMRYAGYLDVRGKLYPAMRHEILNEKEKARVWRDIAVYMKKKGF